MPNLYSYVQRKYWRVELLGYWQLKKLPLFVLAFPAQLLAIYGSWVYFCKRQFGLRSLVERVKDSKNMLPFVLHALFLTFLALFFINVEVITRILFSASPILYWFSGWLVMGAFRDANYVDSILTSHLPSCLWKLWRISSKSGKLVLMYFLTYLVVGCVLHCNFYPWT